MKKFLKGFKMKKLLKVFNIKNILKMFGFKNLLIAALVVTLVVLICYGIGVGFGGGGGSGEGDGNSKIKADGESSSVVEVVGEDVTSTTEPAEEQKGADVFEGAVLAINVVGNDYFYNNERVLLEDFIVIVKGVEGKVVVEVKDDNASLKAYNGLLDELDEINIDYIEK